MGQWGYERQHDALDVDGEAEAEQRDALEGARDWVDDHVDRWQAVLPDLDPHIEGSVTRMQYLAGHLQRVAERSLAEHGLRKEEHETLHTLVRSGWRTSVTQLAIDLGEAPNALTERLDALGKRGFLTRGPSPQPAGDSPRGGQGEEVELTEEGHATWLAAIEASGAEERRLLGTLDWYERKLLASMLRRIVLAAEADDAGRAEADED